MKPLWLLVLLLQPAGLASYDSRRQLNGLYFGWLGHFNMGDELVLDVFGHLMKDSLIQLGWTGSKKRVTLELQTPRKSEVDKSQPWNFTGFDFAVLGGGSLLESYRRFTKWKYFNFCEMAKDAGLPLYVHGTGTQKPMDYLVKATLRCVEPPVFGGVRGPVTKLFLQKLASGLGSKQAYRLDVIGDSGILAEKVFARSSAGIVDDVVSSLAQHKTAGVICLSGIVKFGSMDTAALVEAWSAKYTVIMMPVDSETFRKMDAIYNKTVLNDPGIKGSLFLNPLYMDYGVWLALLDRCDVMLATRLHALIVATSARTPCLVCQEPGRSLVKVQDFFNETYGEGWKDFLLSVDFSGTVPAMGVLLQDVALLKERYKAAVAAATEKVYAAHLWNVKEFMSAIIPQTFDDYSRIAIKVWRFNNYARLELSFD